MSEYLMELMHTNEGFSFHSICTQTHENSWYESGKPQGFTQLNVIQVYNLLLSLLSG